MILPILAYGHSALRKHALDVTSDYQGLADIIADMHETVIAANGVGLAAPQVNVPIRLVVINLDAFSENQPRYKGFRKAYINLHIVSEQGNEWTYEEGCLSVPGINENVSRKPVIVAEYDDEQFVHHRETIDGMEARVLQHEHDHLEGHLFTDKLSSLRRALLRKKFEDISRGVISGKYRMVFPRK